jgi:hypothetical protein
VPTPAVPVDDFMAQEPLVEEDIEQVVEQSPAAGDDWIGPAPQDDDMMLAPAPDASAFQPHPIAYRSPNTAGKKGSDLKQTLIPILLTTGFLLCVMGTLKYILGAESPYSALPTWVIAMMFGTGGVLLALAAFTMMQVNAQLHREAAGKA